MWFYGNFSQENIYFYYAKYIFKLIANLSVDRISIFGYVSPRHWGDPIILIKRDWSRCRCQWNNHYNGHRNNAGEGNNKPAGQNGKRTFADVADLETVADESKKMLQHNFLLYGLQPTPTYFIIQKVKNMFDFK